MSVGHFRDLQKRMVRTEPALSLFVPIDKSEVTEAASLFTGT